MSNLLNCSAHLKSWSQMAETARLWSWGRPSSVMQRGKSDLRLLSASPWGAHCRHERLPLSVSSQRRQAFLTPHPCWFSPAAIISAGGPPLFLLLSFPTGLLSPKAAVSSICLLTSLYPVLLAVTALLLFYFHLHGIIWGQLSSLSSLCMELISLTESFHFHI